MTIRFTKIVAFGLAVCLFFGCTKEYSIDDAGPVLDDAVINIAITASDCRAISSRGHFLQETALTENESISVVVDVIKAGKWTLSTNTLDGFYFAGTGSFTRTGQQEIVLNGTGTPVLPGNYRFSISGTTVGTYLISVLKHDIAEEAVDQKSYLKVTIDGVEYNFDAAVQGPDNIPYGFGFTGNDSAGFSSFLAGPLVLSLQKNFIYPYTSSTDTDFKNFFAPGAYPFVSPGSCNPSDKLPGILIYWADPSGPAWGTRDVSGDQEGSSFTIVGREEGHNAAGNYYVKVKSRFNCTLYNHEDGTSITLTNGEMVSYFIKPL